jgi:hypothetical protein
MTPLIPQCVLNRTIIVNYLRLFQNSQSSDTLRNFHCHVLLSPSSPTYFELTVQPIDAEHANVTNSPCRRKRVSWRFLCLHSVILVTMSSTRVNPPVD